MTHKYRAKLDHRDQISWLKQNHISFDQRHTITDTYNRVIDWGLAEFTNAEDLAMFILAWPEALHDKL